MADYNLKEQYIIINGLKKLQDPEFNDIIEKIDNNIKKDIKEFDKMLLEQLSDD